MILFIFLFILLVLLLQKLQTEKNPNRIEADHRPDQQLLEPGEPFHLEVTLKNKSRRIIPFLRVEENFADAMTPQLFTTTQTARGSHHVEFTAWLRPGQTAVYKIPLTISKRGRYVLQQFQLYSGDFLGLKEQVRFCGTFHEVVAVPEEFPVEALSDLFGGFLGDVSVNRFIIEDPVLTLGYREYTGREPMKMISWTQSARSNSLMVKKYDYTVEPSVSVVLNTDCGGPAVPELLETCFSIARSVCSMLENRNLKYSFSSNCIPAGNLSSSRSLTEGLGQQHFNGILEYLGQSTYDHSITIEQLLEKEAARNTSAGCILITPGNEPEPVRALNRLREATGGTLLVIRSSEVIS